MYKTNMGNITNSKNNSSIDGELRAFKIITFDTYKEMTSKLPKNSYEERVDMYIFPISNDFEKKYNFGLKFRDLEFTKKNIKSKKLELKLKTDYNTTNEKHDGVERWNKVLVKHIDKIKLLTLIQEEYNDTNKTNNTNIINIEGKNNLLNFTEIINTIVNSISNKIELKTLMEQFNESKNSKKLGFALVFKKRYYVEYEQVLIKTISFRSDDKENQVNIVDIQENYYFSLCTEGQISDNSNFMSVLEKHNFDKNMIFGYPELLLRRIEGKLQ